MTPVAGAVQRSSALARSASGERPPGRVTVYPRIWDKQESPKSGSGEHGSSIVLWLDLLGCPKTGRSSLG